VRGHALSTVENLYRGGGVPGLQLLAGQLVGDAVIKTVHLDVVIDRGAHRFPERHDVALGRQRLQRRPIQLGEQAGARSFALAEGAMVELLQ
jgi:hypothetical protein